MTRKDAMQIVVRAAQKYQTHLMYIESSGNLDPHLEKFQKELEKVILIVQGKSL